MEPDRLHAEEHYYRALDLLAEAQPQAAAAGFRDALAADPTFLDAQHGLIRALQDCGAYDEGIVAARSLAAQDPEDVLAYTALSILYQHKGLIPEAEEAGTRAKLLGWKQHLRASAQATAAAKVSANEVGTGFNGTPLNEPQSGLQSGPQGQSRNALDAQSRYVPQNETRSNAPTGDTASRSADASETK